MIIHSYVDIIILHDLFTAMGTVGMQGVAMGTVGMQGVVMDNKPRTGSFTMQQPGVQG